MPEEYDGKELRTSDFYDRLFYVSGTISEDRQVEVNGEYYDLFSHDRELRDRLSELGGTGEEVRFIGRLGMFRGNWQFVIGDPAYLNPEW